MEALGFRYITNVCWVKNRIGLGCYFRGQHELCLFGTMGKFMGPRARNIPSIVSARRNKHSKKPEGFMEMVEAFGHGPRLELFARARREGWDSFGDQL